MPGKRLRDPSLTRTTFPEVVANNGEILTDWEVNNPSNQLVWARPIPLKLIGNAWWQGSYDGVTWDNYVKDDHAYAQLSTDGGVTWLIFKMSSCDGSADDTHPPVTIGVPDGGLVISGDDTQVLTLNPASAVNPGSESSVHWVKTEALKFDYFQNIGGGFELYDTYADVGDDRTHDIRTLVAGTGTTLSYVGDTIVIESTGAGGGQSNLGANVSTDGVGVFDGMNGVYLNFRGIASLTDIITVTLDDVENDIDINIVEANIDHDVLENYVINEHIDHSTVSILTQEGITGGGDLTTTRTLTLAFDELGVQTTVENTDIFAFYRPGNDLHYGIEYSDMKVWIKNHTDIYYVPLTTGVYTTTGLSGGGTLDVDRYINLAFNNLPTVTYNAADYVAIYDVSNTNHAKVTLGDIIGELAVSITEGNGMDFVDITSTGTIDMALPLTVTDSTTNNAGTPGTGHTHTLTIAQLISITDVDNTPVSGEYLKWNGTTWVTGDPAIGATSPGLPLNSIQFNDANTFGGNAGLLYDPTTDVIYFSDANTGSGATLYLGADTNSPYLYVNNDGSTVVLDNTTVATGKLLFTATQIGLGDNGITALADTFLSIKDENVTPFADIFRIIDTADLDLLVVQQDGDIYAPQLSSATNTNILYYDVATGLITYGSPASGTGGISTLIADSLSGLMVNGGSTSSASTIELDQNDFKLTSATPLITDWIGFWDVSTSLQSRVQIGSLPGWQLDVNGVGDYEFNPGDTLNIAEGTGINLSYSLGTLTISSEGSSGTGCTQLVDNLGTITTGGTGYLDLNVFSGGIMTIASGANVTLQFDNIEEGDTGHVEISHNGNSTLTLSAPGATVRIAANSISSGDAIALSASATIDVVAFWYAKGNFHVAVIYDLQ